jgi:hypothetical protein
MVIKIKEGKKGRSYGTLRNDEKLKKCLDNTKGAPMWKTRV